jgi:ABC-type multidrug transport system ATPase subunit
VILAQAITNNPKLLLLDEPTADFDPAARKRVWEIIIDFQRKEETTVILTTPYLDDARAVAQGIVIFNKGKIITQGSVEEVMSNVGYEVEIELENRKEISDIMNAHGIEKIKIDGDRIIAWITWEDLQKIVGSMTSLGLTVSNMKISRPSLDEVYLDILRRV